MNTMTLRGLAPPVAFLFWMGLSSLPLAAQEAIFIVRHAEKADDSANSPLSAEGEARARALARQLRDVGVGAIYSTGFIRTLKTAEPLARALGLEVITEPAHELRPLMNAERPLERYLTELVARLGRLHADEVVLVVGHSNTIPALLKALGHPEPITIASEEYDNVFLIVPRSDGPPMLLRLRF